MYKQKIIGFEAFYIYKKNIYLKSRQGPACAVSMAISVLFSKACSIILQIFAASRNVTTNSGYVTSFKAGIELAHNIT